MLSVILGWYQDSSLHFFGHMKENCVRLKRRRRRNGAIQQNDIGSTVKHDHRKVLNEDIFFFKFILFLNQRYWFLLQSG